MLFSHRAIAATTIAVSLMISGAALAQQSDAPLKIGVMKFDLAASPFVIQISGLKENAVSLALQRFD